MKNLIIITAMLLLAFSMSTVTFAASFDAPKSRHADSVSKIARKDASSFTLDRFHFKQFRKYHFQVSSDYFKPVEGYHVSDTELLKDSDYVSTYRAVAYNVTRHRHSTAHNIFAVGIFAILGTAIASLASFNK